MPEFSDLHDDETERRLEDAAHWIAKLRDPETGDSPILRSEFSRWIADSAANAEAYEELLRLWGLTGQPAQLLVSHVSAHGNGSLPLPGQGAPFDRHGADQTNGAARPSKRMLAATRRTGRERRRGLAALCACLLLMAAISFAFKQTVVTQIASDHQTGTERSSPIQLVEGTSVTLNADSAIAVDINTHHRRVELLEGEAWFEVAENAEVPFKVETKYGDVIVTGTKFNVRLTEDGSAIVSLAEGKVNLSRHNGATDGTVALLPGEEARVNPSYISPPTSSDLLAVTAWRRGQFVFYDAPLADVVNALNRHRSGKIVLLGDQHRSLKISGVFSTTDTNAALSAIEETLPVTVTRLTDYLVLIL